MNYLFVTNNVEYKWLLLVTPLRIWHISGQPAGGIDLKFGGYIPDGNESPGTVNFLSYTAKLPLFPGLWLFKQFLFISGQTAWGIDSNTR